MNNWSVTVMKIFLVVVAGFFISSCQLLGGVQERWQPVERDSSMEIVSIYKINTYECGERSTMFFNDFERNTLISFNIENNCEFPALLETHDSTGMIKAQNIPAYGSLNGVEGIEVNGGLVLQCCFVDTVENKGCISKHTIVGFEGN